MSGPPVRILGGAVLVALAALPAAADAAAPISLASRDGATRVVVDRSPLRVRVLQRDGRVALSSLAGARDLGGVRYAPLAFSTGDEPELRVPVLAGEEDPNPVAPAAPQRFAATGVAGVRRAGGEVRVTLRTGDPGGRRIVLALARDGARAVALTATITGANAAAASAVSAAFASPAAERFHGFGGRREGTDLRGRAFTNWVLDYRFPDVSTSYYDPQAQFLSSRGYGALLDQSQLARWRMASDGAAWRVAARGGRLRLVVAAGGARRAMAALTAITGRHRVAPAWSMRPTLSRTIQVGADTAPGVYEAKVKADVDRILQGDLPVGAYAFEGWAALPRAFVREQIRRLRAKGIRAVLYLRSFTSNDIAGTDPPGRFDTAVREGLVARRADGSPYLVPSPFPGAQAAVLDLTNPRTRAFWRAAVIDLLDTGAEGFMNDFGEQVVPGMRFADGRDGWAMHNPYPALQMRLTREATDAWERRNPGREVFFFNRAGYGGRPGSAAYVDATFPGDETVSWDPGTGLPSVVPDMLNRAVAGEYGFTMDIGGYSDYDFAKGAGQLSPELYARWSQAAVFTTHFRVHNSQLFGVKMPWALGAATQRRWTAAARLHERAIGLLRREWRRARTTGVPPVRPLWLADPAAAGSPRADDQWLVGDDLLVAPVVTKGARSRPVRFPPGCWRREGAGALHLGGRTITVRATLDELPWFTRCGTRPLG